MLKRTDLLYVLMGTLVTLAMPLASPVAHNSLSQFADSDRRTKLERAFSVVDVIAQQRMGELGLPGLVIGIVIDDHLAHLGLFGYRDIERALPVERDSIFRIASMSKSMTALAVMLLRDDGALSLDDPIGRHVPELASIKLPTTDSRPITVRQLLSHTAGFPEDNPWGDRQMDRDRAEFSSWLAAGIPFSTAPGAGYEYSNYGYAILGRIVENASGMAFVDFVDARILKPLGMKSTFWEVAQVPADRRAIGYSRGGGHTAFAPGDSEGALSVDEPQGDGAFGPMGGLFTDAEDLGKWVALMLSAYPPRDNPEDGPALRSTLREMQQGYGFPILSVHRESAAATLRGSAAVYGYGLQIDQSCETGMLVGHGGAFPGFRSRMIWLPESGVGLFLMSNLTYASVGALMDELLDALNDTGGLVPREPRPSEVLRIAATEVSTLIDSWDSEKAKRLAADNLAQDRAMDLRRDDIQALRQGLGRCEQGALRATNALRGTVRVECEGGWLEADLTLAPTRPPRVQYLQVRAARPASSIMDEQIEELVGALHTGSKPVRVDAGFDFEALGARLKSVREVYGHCVRDGILEGDGTLRTRVRLKCDRGPVEMDVRLRDGKLSAVSFAHASGQRCVP